MKILWYQSLFFSFTTSKDKEECSAPIDVEEETHVKRRTVEKNAYYVVASYNGSKLIITKFNLKRTSKIIIMLNG